MLQSLGQGAAELREFLIYRQRAEFGQQHRRKGNTHDPLGQFHQAHGIIVGRDDLSAVRVGKTLAQHSIDLKRSDTDHRGSHPPCHFVDSWIFPRAQPSKLESFRDQGRYLEGCLGNPSHHYPDG